MSVLDEPWLTEYIDKAASLCDVAIDVGANVGTITRELSAERGMRHVVAIEPDWRAFPFLSTLESAHVTCVNAAVSRSSGTIRFHMRPLSVQSSVLKEHPVGGSCGAHADIIRSTDITCVTLDEILETLHSKLGRIRRLFVKVDVEGAEGDVLAGATLPEFRNAIWLIEVHDRAVEVAAELERLGYESVQAIKHPHTKAHPKHFWMFASPCEVNDARNS